MSLGRRRRYHMDDFGDFGFGEPGARDHIAGPLIGGGLAQVGILATKLLFKGSPGITKFAPTIGAIVGAGVSAAMMMSPKFKATGMSGIVTALIVGIPRQIEDLLMGTGMSGGYLGVITPEQEAMAGYFGDEGQQYAGGFGEDQYAGLGAQDVQLLAAQEVQLLDGGAGSTGVLGVTTAEDGSLQGPDVEMMGAGFGANFLSAM